MSGPASGGQFGELLRRQAFWLMLATGLCACGAEDRREADAEGEHIAFILDNSARALCQGSVAASDRFIERVFEFLGEEIPAGYQVQVHVVEDAPCPRSACYLRGDGIYMEQLDVVRIRPSEILRHEIVHAVAYRTWGPAVSFFSEGLAVALSQGAELVPETDDAVPVRDMLDDKSVDLDYWAAGRFTQFLIASRGIDRFKQVYVRAQTASIAAVQAVIEDVYGESLAAIEAEYLNGAPRCLFQLDVCDLGREEKVGSAWTSTFAASCDDPDFYGSIGDDDTQMATQRTLEVEAAGRYRLASEGHMFLTRCGDCDVQFRREFLSSADVELELDMGTYALEVVADHDTVVQVSLVAE